MRKICSVLGALVCIVFLTVLLTSCGQLDPKSHMKEEIYSLFPDATIVDIHEGTSEDNLSYIEYSVQNHGINFTVKNAQNRDNVFSMLSTDTVSDYEAKLGEYFDDEIAAIREKYGMEEQVNYYPLNLSKKIKKLDDANRSLRAMQELVSLLGPYLPTNAIHRKACPIDFEFSLYCYTENGAQASSIGKNGRTYKITCSSIGDFNLKEEYACLQFNIIDSVKTNSCDVECTPEQLNQYPIKKLTTLKVNGETVTSSTYPVEFTYDVLSKKYYAPVCYGSLNLGGDTYDYLQREIITDFYPDAGYNTDKKKGESNYTIGRDRYMIKRIESSPNDSYEFYKNGIPLSIEAHYELNHYDTPVSPCVYISVDDYAALMGMRVDSVNNGCLSLSTN